MPTNRPTLLANRRTVTGKAVARLRRDGQLPGVVYGHGVDSENVALDTHEFELLRRRVGTNALVDLSVDGAKPRPVLVHGVQVDVVSRRPLHVDLFVVRMTEELTVDVPLIATGLAPAVDLLGGTLIHVSERLRVRALPGNIPDSLPYAIDGLTDFDAAVHVRDLAVPEGATILADPDDVVAKVERPRVEAAEVTEPAEAEAAEGAAAPAEAAATGDEAGES